MKAVLVSDKTHGYDGSKTLSELQREHDAWRESQPMVTRCALAGCRWKHDGTVGSGRDAAAAHRAEKHPEIKKPRTRRQVEDDQRAEKRGDADAAKVEQQERRLQGRAATRPQGRPKVWTAEKIVAARQACHARDGVTPTDATEGAPPYKATKREFGSWGAGIAAAGLTPRKRDSRPAAVADPGVTGSADSSTGDDAAGSPISPAASLPVQPSGLDVDAAIAEEAA